MITQFVHQNTNAYGEPAIDPEDKPAMALSAARADVHAMTCLMELLSELVLNLGDQHRQAGEIDMIAAAAQGGIDMGKRVGAELEGLQDVFGRMENIIQRLGEGGDDETQ